MLRKNQISYLRHRDEIYAALGRTPPKADEVDTLKLIEVKDVPKPPTEVEDKEGNMIIAGVWMKTGENMLQHIQTGAIIRKIVKYGQYIYQLMIENQVVSTHGTAKEAMKYYASK